MVTPHAVAGLETEPFHARRQAGAAGLLVEFGSVVDTTECAVAIQRMMPEREADAPEEQRIQYRVGINLGDIVIDGDDTLLLVLHSIPHAE